jgi:hypothetical protein
MDSDQENRKRTEQLAEMYFLFCSHSTKKTVSASTTDTYMLGAPVYLLEMFHKVSMSFIFI